MTITQDEPDILPARVIRALDETDQMPPDLRRCVHEYGFAIVKACIFAGVTQPNRIRQLVKEIWDGARQPHQRRTLHKSRTQSHSGVLDKLDWLLIQSGSSINAATLVRVLWQNGMVILPIEPSSVAIEASMAEVATFDQRITKYDKHRLRLRAAARAQAERLWPHLFEDASRKNT